MVDKSAFGKKLRDARQKKGYTQHALAEIADIGNVVGIFHAINHWTARDRNFASIVSQTAVAANQFKRYINIVINNIASAPLTVDHRVAI